MYNLFVSYQVEERNEGEFNMEKNRFLEYTDDTISALYHPLSTEAIECIKSWPCILMQEGRGQESAYIAQILNIDVSDTQINLKAIPLPVGHEIINDSIWKIRDELDIAQFEFSRNHWAIKNRDLFSILSKAGYVLDDTSSSKFDNKLLRLPNRSDLLSARNVISDWSHTEIDDFLLEAGGKTEGSGKIEGSSLHS